MFRKVVVSFSLFFSVSLSADSVMEKYWEEPVKHGQADFKAMMMNIYMAELYSGEEAFSMDDSYALKLTYKRKLKGSLISDKSIELIRKQGVEDEVALATWHSQLESIFPDVQKGTEIVGAHVVGEGAFFYVDGELAGTLTDPELCERFFGIWLSEQAAKPKTRAKLLGDQLEI